MVVQMISKLYAIGKQLKAKVLNRDMKFAKK